MASGLRSGAMNGRAMFVAMLGCLLVAGAVGCSSPAAAQRGGSMGGGGFGRPGPGPMGPGRMGPGPGGGMMGPGIGLGFPPIVVVPGGPGPGPGGGPPPGAVTSGRGGGNPRGGGGGGGGGTAAQANQPFVANEIVTAFAAGTTPQAIDALSRRYNLTPLETQDFPLIGTSLYRWRIGGGRAVATLRTALGRERIVANVQPNFLFILQEETAPAPASAPEPAPALSGPPQYVLDKLQVRQAQQIATGKNVLVAVIDSAVDAKLPELDGAIAKSFDALPGGTGTAHAHGTSIAGAIVAHGALTGIAPGAQLLAVHAFDDTAGIAKGTSYAIYKGLQWATDNGARVINMSFAGPADPTLQRMLAAAYDKGIVLIAAAGNGGPKADPPYPGADSNVIAVTATDKDDRLYPMANRGRYLAVAAPGVDVVALAPQDKMQFATGTSIAAAHVSGIAALLLERKPSLKPGDIRAALISTATRLGPPRPDSDFGAGLVSAYRAVTAIDRKPPEAGDAQAKQ